MSARPHTKNGRARTVPLHEHLLEQGFVDFAQSKGKGPLFSNPSQHRRGATTTHYENRAQEVADRVRGFVILPATGAPPLGWRGSQTSAFDPRTYASGMPSRGPSITHFSRYSLRSMPNFTCELDKYPRR